MIPAFLRNFFLACGWIGGLGALAYLLDPSAWSVLFSGDEPFWDVEHYAFIATQGYDELRTAFFPGFPMLWKLTGLSLPFMSILNALFACAGLGVFMTAFKARGWEVALCLSQPLIVFWCIPYSESLFFLFIACALLALQRRWKVLLFISLLLAAYCRPLWSVLVPALIILSAINWNDKTMRWTLLTGLAGIGLGSFLVFWLHLAEDFGWGAFFSAQREWGNHLRLPEFPLSSWSDWQVVMLDASAFGIGIAAGVALLRRLIQGRMKGELVLHLSLLYLLGVSLLVLLFRGGDMFSLGRFVFTTPFLLFVMLHLARTTKPSWSHLRWLLIPLVVAVTFGAWVHISYILKFLLLPIVVMLFLLTGWLPIRGREWTRWLFIAAVFMLNLYFWSRALAYEWIG